jgi:hypothetical protein
VKKQFLLAVRVRLLNSVTWVTGQQRPRQFDHNMRSTNEIKRYKVK